MNPIDAAAHNEEEIFRALLVPHRSLGRKGFLIVMAAIGGSSFLTGLFFLSLGAWPVFGFFGLDVLDLERLLLLGRRPGRDPDK